MTNEYVHSINGVEGRMFDRHEWPNGLFSTQTWKASRPFSAPGYKPGSRITVELRFDDNCKNGHQSFSITGSVKEPGARDISMGGCIHEEIAKAFPELASLIKWHLTSTDGPMHYISNTVYMAGDRDCWGLRKGEKRQVRNGKTGKLSWIATASAELEKYVDSDTRPTDSATVTYEPWFHTGEGKERELDSARRAAVWLDAPDSILCADPAELKAALAARLPALIADFRTAMESCGFEWREISVKEPA